MRSTGEGSWRTKSAANKVYAVEEKVEAGRLIISYVGTKEQCADSLTKFLRGGPDQVRARQQLSLADVAVRGKLNPMVCRVQSRVSMPKPKIHFCLRSRRQIILIGPQQFRLEFVSRLLVGIKKRRPW